MKVDEMMADSLIKYQNKTEINLVINSAHIFRGGFSVSENSILASISTSKVDGVSTSKRITYRFFTADKSVSAM